MLLILLLRIVQLKKDNGEIVPYTKKEMLEFAEFINENVKGYLEKMEPLNTETEDLWGGVLNENFERIDRLGTWQPPVITKTLSSPPGGTLVGDRYIVAATGSGPWTGHTGDIAEYVATDSGNDCGITDNGVDFNQTPGNRGAVASTGGVNYAAALVNQRDLPAVIGGYRHHQLCLLTDDFLRRIGA